jgi:hypothetical protein
VTVLSLEEVRVEPDGAALVTAGITQPGARGPVGTPTFVVRGWALGAGARALAVEIRAADRLVRVAAVRDPTPDIAAAYPDRPEAAHCGFLTRAHAGALAPASEVRLEAVLADGTRASIGTIALGRSEAPGQARRRRREPPSIRAEVEQLARSEAERVGLDPAALFGAPDFAALERVELAGRTVLDLSGGPGHVARAARARGAALVDSVHLGDDCAALARLLDLHQRATRVFVHDSLAGLDRRYDVVLALGPPPPLDPAALQALGGTVVRP